MADPIRGTYAGIIDGNAYNPGSSFHANRGLGAMTPRPDHKGAIKMLAMLSSIESSSPSIIAKLKSSWVHDKASNTLLINRNPPFRIP